MPSTSLDMGVRTDKTSGSSVTHGGQAGVRRGTSESPDLIGTVQGSAVFLKCLPIQFFDYAHSKFNT